MKNHFKRNPLQGFKDYMSKSILPAKKLAFLTVVSKTKVHKSESEAHFVTFVTHCHSTTYSTHHQQNEENIVVAHMNYVELAYI